jgi:hypothetical protein
LHRDISENNVMINLVGESGLLIDLDMAKDFREPENASIIDASITHVFPVRVGADQPEGTVPHVSVPSASSRTQGTLLKQEAGNVPSQDAGVREPITVCSYH